MKKRPVRVVLGLTALLLVSGGFLIAGLKPAWYVNLLAGMQRSREGWSIEREGDHKPLGLRLWAMGYQHPASLKPRYTSVRDDYVGYFYFAGLKPFPQSNANAAVPKNYARLETPSGEFVYLDVESSFEDPGVCFVQIPPAYRPDLEYLKLALVKGGHDDTVIRIDRPPATAETLPQKASPVVKKTQDGVALQAEAFLVVSPKDGKSSGIGGKVSWTKPDPKFFWRSNVNMVARPFGRVGTTARNTGSMSSIEALNRPSMKMIEAVPFASDISLIGLSGRLDGFETRTESVDFGTMTLVEDKKSNGQDRRFYLDLTKSISRTLPSGVKLILLPLPDGREQHSFYGGGASLYFRLKAEAPTTGLFTTKALDNAPPIVEAKLIGVLDYYQSISPPGQTGGSVDNLMMMLFKPPASRKLDLKFDVRTLDLRRRIPFDFRVPVDRTKPLKYGHFGHSNTGNMVAIE